MANVLVLYYSSYGHIERMAQEVAAGVAAMRARRRPSCACRKRCPRTWPANPVSSFEQQTPVAKIDDLAGYDAIIFGTPTRFGNMAGQMKSFLDQAGGLWLKGSLVARSRACSRHRPPNTAGRNPPSSRSFPC